MERIDNRERDIIWEANIEEEIIRENQWIWREKYIIRDRDKSREIIK